MQHRETKQQHPANMVQHSLIMIHGLQSTSSQSFLYTIAQMMKLNEFFSVISCLFSVFRHTLQE